MFSRFTTTTKLSNYQQQHLLLITSVPQVVFCTFTSLTVQQGLNVENNLLEISSSENTGFRKPLPSTPRSSTRDYFYAILFDVNAISCFITSSGGIGSFLNVKFSQNKMYFRDSFTTSLDYSYHLDQEEEKEEEQNILVLSRDNISKIEFEHASNLVFIIYMFKIGNLYYY